MVRVMRAVWTRLRRQRGFTLIELMAVMAILSGLSAITFPAISGSVTVSKGTTQSVDMASAQRAVDWFHSEAVTLYPTEPAPDGATTPWATGGLPQGSATGGTGVTAATPIIFTQNDIAGIDFQAQVLVNGTTKTFNGDYLRGLPRHAGETLLLQAGEDSPVFHIKRRGADTFVLLRNTGSVATVFHLWGLDKASEVWLFVDRIAY